MMTLSQNESLPLAVEALETRWAVGLCVEKAGFIDAGIWSARNVSVQSMCDSAEAEL